MSLNRPQYPSTGTDLQTLPATSAHDPLAQVETLKIVACPLCRAVYIPLGESQERCPTGLLETAFLNVCHFCFRCQQPACPQCWNPIHHACASCCAEANLPFRSPVPALEGLVLLPPASAQAETAQISFTCQRNGRFFMSEAASPVQLPPAEAPTESGRVTSDALPVLQLAPAQEAPSPTHSAYPDWLQEVLGPRSVSQSLPVPAEPEPTDQAGTLPAVPPVPVAPVAQPEQTNWPHLALTAPQPGTFSPQPALPAPVVQPFPPTMPASAPEIQATEEAPHQEQEASEEPSLFERIENVLIVLTSLLLLAVVLMIVLSICFAQVNTFFLTMLHIDIRTEIAYLLQLR